MNSKESACFLGRVNATRSWKSVDLSVHVISLSNLPLGELLQSSTGFRFLVVNIYVVKLSNSVGTTCLCMMVSYRVLRVVLVFLFLHLRTQHCTYATEIIRDVKGDLFSITHCGPPSRCKANGTPCTLPPTCRDKEAVCEGSLCCMCRCPAHSLRPTYVDDKSRNVSGCVDNSKLPMKLSMDENGMIWLINHILTVYWGHVFYCCSVNILNQLVEYILHFIFTRAL